MAHAEETLISMEICILDLTSAKKTPPSFPWLIWGHFKPQKQQFFEIDGFYFAMLKLVFTIAKERIYGKGTLNL